MLLINLKWVVLKQRYNDLRLILNSQRVGTILELPNFLKKAKDIIETFIFISSKQITNVMTKTKTCATWTPPKSRLISSTPEGYSDYLLNMHHPSFSSNKKTIDRQKRTNTIPDLRILCAVFLRIRTLLMVLPLY